MLQLVSSMYDDEDFIVTKDRPTKGQFIMIWLAEGKVWSMIMRYSGSELELYNEDICEFSYYDEEELFGPDFMRSTPIIYVTNKEK